MGHVEVTLLRVYHDVSTLTIAMIFDPVDRAHKALVKQMTIIGSKKNSAI